MIRRRLMIGSLLLLPGALAAQERRNEVFYRPGSFNWSFLKAYPEAARLFNAFDYGHAILYELLLTRPGLPAARLEREEFDFITRDLLVRPPRFAAAEEAIAPNYAKLAWRAKQMFDRAHILHRQIYDAYADERLSDSAKAALVERLTDWYLLDTEGAFTAAPKSMALMDEQHFSQVFRREVPKFNGLIWAYHWLQVGLYEPLILGRTREERVAGVKRTVDRFWEMVQGAPDALPRVMPMTAAVAPTFAERHVRAAVIFDNLHMMHDIISDILASPQFGRGEQRDLIYRNLTEFQDPSSNVMDLEHWRMMGDHMGGVERMGGSVRDLLGLPARGGEPPHQHPPPR